MKGNRMSVKDPAAVNQYSADQIACENALINLHEFVTSLPQPCRGQLPSPISYSAVANICKLRCCLADASKIADEFWRPNGG